LESGDKIRLHLSSESAEIMPEFLSTLAKHTAGTLSFNQLEAVSMLKTQHIHKNNMETRNSGQQRMPVGQFSSNRIFPAKTGHRTEGIRLLGFWKTVMKRIRKNTILICTDP
jgi:hypothetical protein